MEAKYKEALKAGIVGSLILAIVLSGLLIISFVFMAPWLLYSSKIIITIVSVIPGALAVRYNLSILHSKWDAAYVSFIAGAIAGIIGVFISEIIGNFAVWALYGFYPSIDVCLIFILFLYAVTVGMTSTASGLIYYIFIAKHRS